MAHFLSLRDSGQEGVWRLLDAVSKTPEQHLLDGKRCCALLAEQSATALEDRLSYAATVEGQGGHLLTLEPGMWRTDMESLVLQSALYTSHADAVLLRDVPQNVLEVFAANAAKPVFNMGNATSRPAVALADIALLHRRVENLSTLRVAWVGGLNGLAYSLIEAAMFVPFEFFIALPDWCAPDHDVLDLALRAGAKIFLSHDLHLVLDDAAAVYIGTGPAAENAPLDAGMRLTASALSLAHPQALLLTGEPLSPRCHAEDALLEAAQPLYAERLALRQQVQAELLRSVL